jgi:hypothetical protein
MPRFVPRRFTAWAPCLLALSAISCTVASCTSAPPAPSFPVTPREAGVRAPITADCNALEDIHCLLPWPSSSFLVADASTATGVRVEVSAASMNAEDEANVWAADGFSRATSVLTGLGSFLDPATVATPPTHVGGALRLYVASPDHPDYGQEVPLRLETIDQLRGEMGQTLVLGDPLVLLDPATDYVAVLTDTVRTRTGDAVPVPHSTRIALGLEAPASEAEAELAGYHAPTAALLREVGVDPAHVLRAWDFTTRSQDDPRHLLLAIRDATLAALERGEIEFVIDDVTHRESGDIATIVRGHMTGLPDFIDDSRDLVLDADGTPRASGTDESPFRVVIPRGTGDYRTVLFGHGAGGSANDGTFDEALAAEGIAKVGMELTGFHGDVLLQTIMALGDRLFVGIRRAVGPLMQAIAQAVAIERALGGPLGDVLSAETLGGWTACSGSVARSVASRASWSPRSIRRSTTPCSTCLRAAGRSGCRTRCSTRSRPSASVATTAARSARPWASRSRRPRSTRSMARASRRWRVRTATCSSCRRAWATTSFRTRAPSTSRS